MRTPRLHLLIGLLIVTSTISPPVTILTTIQHLASTTKNSTLAFLLPVMRAFLVRTLLTSFKPGRTRSLMELRPQKSVFLQRRNRKSTLIKAACNRGPKEGELWAHPSSSRRSRAGGKQGATHVQFPLDEVSTTGLRLCICSFNHAFFLQASCSMFFFFADYSGTVIDVRLACILLMDGLERIAHVY